MSGKFLGLVVATLVAIGIGTGTFGLALADNSHVEYFVEPQPGISVVQHGNAGLVEVTVTDCLVAGETFTFEMLISSDREGHSDLLVRKNSGVDISSWFSLDPNPVDLPSDGTVVNVKIEPPDGAELDWKAVTRIQEIGDPPAPGGHHGVKVSISCVEMPEPPVEPTPTLTPEVTPKPTPSSTPVASSMVQPPEPTLEPEPKMPTALPDSGGEPPLGGNDVIGKFLLIAGGSILSLLGGFVAWRYTRFGFF